MANFYNGLSLEAQMSRINQIIADLPEKLTAPIRNTIFTQASLVASEQKSVAPVDPTSETPGALRASIRVEELPPKGNKFYRVAVKAGGKATKKHVANGKAGFPYDYDYVRAVEFGTINERAHPFFFPIWRARRKAVRAAVRASIKKAVQGIKF